MQVIAIQMTSTDDVNQNLAVVAEQLANINFQQPSLVLLPENFALYAHSKAYQKHAELLDVGAGAGASTGSGNSAVQTQLAKWAKQYNIWLVAGSFPIRHTSAEVDSQTLSNKQEIIDKKELSDNHNDQRVYTTSLVFNPQGELVQHYHKLHLFDVVVPATIDKPAITYKESDSFLAGQQTAMFDFEGIKVGMVICYDLRFPELFRQLRQQGADVILVPAAFTATTGKAHWLTLLQARAIENQCYVLAANQVGQHNKTKSSWGHSVIVDPWGEVITQINTDVGHISATVDKQKLAQIRADMPILQHARFTTSLQNKE